MIKSLLRRVAAWLLTLTYERITVDTINKKLIAPVPGLIINGEQYYEYVSLTDMCDSRFVHFQNFAQELTMGIDRKAGNDYAEAIIKANNEGDRSRIGALTWMFRDTINNCTPIESMYNLASLLYFTVHEDLKCYDADYNTEKIKAFKALPNQSFFLTRLIEKGLKRPGEVSQDNTLEYLNESVVKLRAYRSMLLETED